MAATLNRLHEIEIGLSLRAARRFTAPYVIGGLRLASRVGDWYLSLATALLLLVAVSPALASRFTLASLVGLALQQTLKRTCSRTRPCSVAGGPPQRVGIPDAGSFPSGHTLHGVLCAVTAAAALPVLAVVYLPLAMLIAISRVALGVHYASDVAAGAALGLLLTFTVL